jgi:hypothetical protein
VVSRRLVCGRVGPWYAILPSGIVIGPEISDRKRDNTSKYVKTRFYFRLLFQVAQLQLS